MSRVFPLSSEVLEQFLGLNPLRSEQRDLVLSHRLRSTHSYRLQLNVDIGNLRVLLLLFESVLYECISLRQLRKPCVHFFCFHFHGNWICAKAISCVSQPGPWKMTQQHLICQFPINLFCLNTQTEMHTKAYSRTVPLTKLLLQVLGRKGPAGKSVARINKAIFCRVSGWHLGYLLWGGGGDDRWWRCVHVGRHIALLT